MAQGAKFKTVVWIGRKEKKKVTSVCLNITFGGGAASIQQEFLSLEPLLT